MLRRRQSDEEVDDELELTEEEPKTRRGWTFYGSLGVLAVILGVAAAYFVLPSPSAPQPFTGPAVSVSAPGVESTAGPCHFPAAAAGEVTIAPTDVTWSLAGSMATPSSAAAGPANPGLIPSCYARSPQGALLAAVNWITTMQNPKVDKVAAVQALVAHTGGYDQFLASFEADSAGGSVDSLGQQISAFRMLFFDPSHAEMEIVSRSTSGGAPGFMASVVYVLVWENDDWKIAPVLDGGAPITGPVDAITAPYIAFNGA